MASVSACWNGFTIFSSSPVLVPVEVSLSSVGEDIVAARGGVKVIPEEIRVRVDRGDTLGTRADVYQRVSGWRGDDALEEGKDVELRQIEMPVRVEVAQNSEP